MLKLKAGSIQLLCFPTNPIALLDSFIPNNCSKIHQVLITCSVIKRLNLKECVGLLLWLEESKSVITFVGEGISHLSPCFNFKISHVKVESRVNTTTMFSHKSYRIARLFHSQQLVKNPTSVNHMFCYQKVKFERVYWSIALIERVKKRDNVWQKRYKSLEPMF